MRQSIIALSVVAFLAGCGEQQTTPAISAETADPCAAVEGDGVVVVDAWVRAAGEGQKTSAAYMTLCNAGDISDTLLAASSDAAAAVEIHETKKDEAGVTTMTPSEGVVIEAGNSAVLEPGGAHIMLIGLTDPIEIDEVITLTLDFQHGAPVTVSAKAHAAAAGGHQHH